jgi:carboxylesterase
VKKAIIIIPAIVILWGATYLLNETPFLYKTPSAYIDAKPGELASPEYGPINIINQKSDSAVIFLAGFKGTPAQFLYMSEVFKKGYNIISPLYPGSGTKPEEFVRTFYTQWYAKSKDTYLEARKKFRHVYLCGFSMGGTIALRLAEEYPAGSGLAPDAVICISAPVFSNNVPGEGVLYDWRLYFVRYLSWFITALKKPYDPDIKAAPGPGSYDTAHFLKQVYSLEMGMRDAMLGLKKVTAPLLLMQAARGDMHSPYQNLFYIAKHVSSGIIKVRAFDLSGKEYEKTTRHFIPHYPGTRDEVIKEIQEFIGLVKQTADISKTGGGK